MEPVRKLDKSLLLNIHFMQVLIYANTQTHTTKVQYITYVILVLLFLGLWTVFIGPAT